MSGDIPDDLEREVEAWFFEHVEDVIYSEALYELMKILDYNELTLWGRVLEAEESEEKALDERDELRDEIKQLEEQIEELSRE